MPTGPTVALWANMTSPFIAIPFLNCFARGTGNRFELRRFTVFPSKSLAVTYGIPLLENSSLLGKIYRLLLLKSIHITRYVEVVVILRYFTERGFIAVFILLTPLPVGLYNLVDIPGAQFVLVFDLFKMGAGIDKQHIFRGVPGIF